MAERSVDYLLEDMWLPTFDDLVESSSANKDYKKALKKKDYEKIAWLLNEEFRQGVVTRGDVTLLGAVVMNKKMEKILAVASEGEVKGKGFSEKTIQNLLERKGKERYQRYYGYWKTDEGLPVVSMIAPLGGLSIKGYLVMHASIVSPLVDLHQSLQGEVTVLNMDTEESLHHATVFEKGAGTVKKVDMLTSDAFFPTENPVMKVRFKSDVSKVNEKLFVLEVIAVIAQLLIISVVGIITGFILKKKVFVVLRGVKDRIHSVAQGRLSSHKEEIDLEDEIGEVNNAVNDMSDQLISLTSNLTNAAETLNTVVDGYTASSEEMMVTASVVAQNSTECLDSANNAQQTVTGGQSILSNLTQGFQTISNVSGDAKSKVESLHEHGNNIQGIVSMIEDIADRINLLALNASIEAARAGDAGRGFSVVADEVRKLADETTSAIGSVDKTIVALRDEVGGAQQGMEAVISAVEEGESNVQATQELLNSITESTMSITASIEGIATMAEEQSSTLETNNEQVVSIKEVSEKLLEDTQRFQIVDK